MLLLCCNCLALFDSAVKLNLFIKQASKNKTQINLTITRIPYRTQHTLKHKLLNVNIK